MTGLCEIGLHELNRGEESGSCEAIGYNALDINVLVLRRSPELE